MAYLLTDETSRRQIPSGDFACLIPATNAGCEVGRLWIRALVGGKPTPCDAGLPPEIVLGRSSSFDCGCAGYFLGLALDIYP